MEFIKNGVKFANKEEELQHEVGRLKEVNRGLRMQLQHADAICANIDRKHHINALIASEHKPLTVLLMLWAGGIGLWAGMVITTILLTV